MNELFTGIIDLIKSGRGALSLVCSALAYSTLGAILLYAPIDAIAPMRERVISEPWFVVSVLASLAMAIGITVAHGINAAWTWFKPEPTPAFVNRIETASFEELAILLTFVHHNRRRLRLPSDGHLRALVSAGLIRCVLIAHRRSDKNSEYEIAPAVFKYVGEERAELAGRLSETLQKKFQTLPPQ